MTHDLCPFPSGTDEAALWQMLIFDDINAFVACDWDAHASAFLKDSFLGISGHKSHNPQDWAPDFPTLDLYRDTWLGDAKAAAARADAETLRRAHFTASRLAKITVNDTLALCVKRFDGSVTYRDGVTEPLAWETAYICRNQHGRWWIAGFVGFLPH